MVQQAWSALPPADGPLRFAEVPFDHPLWILWSSGTAGVPKGIVQGHGGITVELLKALGLGVDLRPQDRYLFVTSTSWMVWNFLVGGLLHGSTIVLHDGSPTHPDTNGVWRIAARTGATVVGVGAAYLAAGEKADTRPAQELNLGALRTILQTGPAMAPGIWRWTHERFPGGPGSCNPAQRPQARDRRGRTAGRRKAEVAPRWGLRLPTHPAAHTALPRHAADHLTNAGVLARTQAGQDPGVVF